MKIEKFKYRRNGSLVVEFVLGLHLFIFFFISILVFTRWNLLRQRLLQIARMGADLQAWQEVPSETVTAILELQLEELKNLGFQGSLRTGPYREIPGSFGYHFIMSRVESSFEVPFLKKMGIDNLPLRETVVLEKARRD